MCLELMVWIATVSFFNASAHAEEQSTKGNGGAGITHDPRRRVQALRYDADTNADGVQEYCREDESNDVGHARGRCGNLRAVCVAVK